MFGAAYLTITTASETDTSTMAFTRTRQLRVPLMNRPPLRGLSPVRTHTVHLCVCVYACVLPSLTHIFTATVVILKVRLNLDMEPR